MIPQHTPLQIQTAREHAIRRSRMQMAARRDKPEPAMPVVTLVPMKPVKIDTAPAPINRDILYIASAPDEFQIAAPAPATLFTVRGIIRAISLSRSIPVEALCSPRRTADLVEARQDAMFIAWALTSQSLPELGKRFGGRDHTTILHAVRKRCDEFEIAGLPDIRERAKRIATQMLFNHGAMCADNAGRG